MKCLPAASYLWYVTYTFEAYALNMPHAGLPANVRMVLPFWSLSRAEPRPAQDTDWSRPAIWHTHPLVVRKGATSSTKV